MRVLGVLLVLLGLLVAGVGYGMDTTVPLLNQAGEGGASAGRRVHNIGKLEWPRDVINAGSVMLIVGAVFIALGRRAPRPPEPDPRNEPERRGWLDLSSGSGDASGRR